MEGGTYEALPFAEEDRLEVVLLPLLVPIDLGEELRSEVAGKALEGKGREELTCRHLLIVLLGDESLHHPLTLLEALEAYGAQLGDQPVAEVFVRDRGLAGGIVVV